MLGDARDLSTCPGASFDLVVHPVSNLFIPELEPVWRECHRVLRPGGTLLSGFLNPDVYLFDAESLEARGELVVRHSLPYSDITHLEPAERERLWGLDAPVEYSHTLTEQLGGQIAAGFAITASPRHHTTRTPPSAGSPATSPRMRSRPEPVTSRRRNLCGAA
nr:class I SAM-dependent methyltransferase [Streptomyces sp. alain-838]